MYNEKSHASHEMNVDGKWETVNQPGRSGQQIYHLELSSMWSDLTFLSRKYSRLRVRYSRLQQGPVRFTFTPGGQMVEEDEEDEGARETQMESLQSDNDEKPIL